MSKILYSAEHVRAAWVHDHLYEYNLTHTGCERQEVSLPENPDLQTFLVCSDDEGKNPVGGAVWRIRKEDHILFIEYLWVHESTRGTGAGGKLIQAVMNAAAEHHCPAVEVTTNTFQAPAFYQKQGFRVIGGYTAPVPLCPNNIHYRLKRDVKE